MCAMAFIRPVVRMTRCACLINDYVNL